ncbi:MAG: mechanosensitive ion channel domain-containing protein [Pseudomonadota bacterium]
MTQWLDSMEGWLGHPLVADFGTALIAVVLGLIIIRILQGFAVRSIAQTDTRYRVRKFIGLAGYIVLVLVLISMLSSQLGQLSVIFGVAGAGIAFSLQEVIASIAGWIAISFGGFYRPGNRVQVGGITGDVIDIGMLRTTIMETGGWVNGDNYNGRIVKVANSFIFKEPVYNYTGDFNFLWDEFTVPVKYGSDWHLAQKMIEKAVTEQTQDFETDSAQEWKGMVKKYLIEEASTAPSVTLFADENWITFTARYVVDFQRRRSTKDAIMRSILTAFEGSKGKVEFAGAAIEITGMPRIEIESGT